MAYTDAQWHEAMAELTDSIGKLVLLWQVLEQTYDLAARLTAEELDEEKSLRELARMGREKRRPTLGQFKQRLRNSGIEAQEDLDRYLQDLIDDRNYVVHQLIGPSEFQTDNPPSIREAAKLVRTVNTRTLDAVGICTSVMLAKGESKGAIRDVPESLREIIEPYSKLGELLFRLSD